MNARILGIIVGLVVSCFAARSLARSEGVTTYAPIIGANESDFGGKSEIGAVVGVRLLRNASVGGIQLGGAFEYLQKVSSGPIGFYDSSIGESVPLGNGRVDLRYVHGTVDLRYAILIADLMIAPYGGAGISLLLSQSVNLDTEAQYPDTLGWYRGMDADLQLGCTISYARILADMQYSAGLGSLGKGTSGLDGGGGLRTFSSNNESMATVRVAVGYMF